MRIATCTQEGKSGSLRSMIVTPFKHIADVTAAAGKGTTHLPDSNRTEDSECVGN
jgi:hypothetical protein